ncbi:hypothetical protein [Candidatus Deianiraea vastatrix]|uniref:Uncharacterized protein n=1 Tax=Candidatus Deianiraea vastatrix TaxID=2163644 RepID=A0A5B8XF69_9RICK|nr:hypothetical protein [Candidatus Deianiraea vastatrix]QED23910.1 hypothetical protein Deia_01129 [Candidatus Deianiraea vastatrix]
MSFFTKEEKAILNQQQRSWQLSLGGDARSVNQRELQRVKQKLARYKEIGVQKLTKTHIGKIVGARSLGVINRNRSDYRECVLVTRFFQQILRNISVLAIPRLHGVRLTLAERKLLMRIMLQKRYHIENLKRMHDRIQDHAFRIRTIDKTKDIEVRKLEKTLSLEKDCQAMVRIKNDDSKSEYKKHNEDIDVYESFYQDKYSEEYVNDQITRWKAVFKAKKDMFNI